MDPARPYAFLVEPERTPAGQVEDVATVFITNRECPFKCLMCDLWRNTTTGRVLPGGVAEQVRFALDRLPPVRHVKLYNSGNFFDDHAISPRDRAAMVDLIGGYRTVIVECHPKLVDHRSLKFAGKLDGELNVAMGLETVDPSVLPRLNKRMTLDDFRRATEFLLDSEIRVRAFILLRTPFQSEEQGVHWAMRSIDFAFSIGVECCALVPTRAGNGAMEWLQQRGLFQPPSLRSLETALGYGLGLARGRVFADLWDIEKLTRCERCGAARAERLGEMNRSQTILPAVECVCGT